MELASPPFQRPASTKRRRHRKRQPSRAPRLERKRRRQEHTHNTEKHTKRKRLPHWHDGQLYDLTCKYYQRGLCEKGRQCPFAHEQRSEVCTFYLAQRCTKQDCPFLHDVSHIPCKFYHVYEDCEDGEQCRFSHKPLSANDLKTFFEEEMKRKTQELENRVPVEVVPSAITLEDMKLNGACWPGRRYSREELRACVYLKGLLGQGESYFAKFDTARRHGLL